MTKVKIFPQIEFRTSRIYNAQWTRSLKYKNPPSKEDWVRREKKLRALWAVNGKVVLQLMSKVTGLEWREERIIVYLTWGIPSFSDPLTLNLRKDAQVAFETLTHELIHRICSEPQNHKLIAARWQKFVRKFPNEQLVAINHVPIHAVHEVIWEKLFPRRVAAIKQDLKLKPYIRSWKLVDTIGAHEVIKKIFKTSKPR